MIKVIFTTAILIIVVGSVSYAQTSNQFHSWWTYSGNHKISEKSSLQTLYSFRRNDFIKDWQQSLLRLGMNYKVNDKILITPGYDFVITFPYGDQSISHRTNEHRATLQVLAKYSIGAIGLSHRYRFEQRFIESVNETLSRQRLRYRMTVNIPMSKSFESQNKGLFLTFFNEVFVNVGNEVGNHIFDQNWIYGGIGYKINNSSNLKLGYMNQYLIKGNNINRENNHTVMVSINKNLI